MMVSSWSRSDLIMGKIYAVPKLPLNEHYEILDWVCLYDTFWNRDCMDY
jgi:hypothetical protein